MARKVIVELLETSNATAEYEPSVMTMDKLTQLLHDSGVDYKIDLPYIYVTGPTLNYTLSVSTIQ